ncbi:TPA: thioredoxin fold domain-containing protein [Escherichia coli]
MRIQNKIHRLQITKRKIPACYLYRYNLWILHQKLHHDLKSYLDAGISIKFLAFPRAGLNSVVAGNMAKIWCSAKPNEALDAAMNPVSTIPEGRPDEACLNIIKSHFQVASTIPLQGTPTMVTLSGKPQLFTGWLSPENLVTQMGAAQK